MPSEGRPFHLKRKARPKSSGFFYLPSRLTVILNEKTIEA